MYIGLHALPARVVQKGVAGASRNRALWVKLVKIFDVPGVALQADYAGPGDSYYPIGAFPLWRQLV